MIARYLGMGLLVCASWLGAQAQQKLADLVDEAKADWMLGKWEAQTDNGGTVTLAFSWDLDKHVIVLHVKTPDMELKGYSALDPSAANEVKYFGFDNRGAISKGNWAPEGSDLVLRIETQTSERTVKMAAVFGGSATEGLQIRIHSIESSGSLSATPRMALKFKKQK